MTYTAHFGCSKSHVEPTKNIWRQSKKFQIATIATIMAPQLSKPNQSVAISNNTSYPNFSAIGPLLLLETCL
jgi:hypothetical protein